MVFFDKIIRPTYYGYARRSCRSSEEQPVSENSLYFAVLFFSGSTASVVGSFSVPVRAGRIRDVVWIS